MRKPCLLTCEACEAFALEFIGCKSYGNAGGDENVDVLGKVNVVTADGKPTVSVEM